MIKVFRHRNYILLWLGQSVSNIGDWAIWTALSYYTYQITNSVLATGIMFLASVVPGVLFGSALGVFIDQWDRKLTMLCVDVLRALLLVFMLFVHTANNIWIIYVINFLFPLARFSSILQKML